MPAPIKWTFQTEWSQFKTAMLGMRDELKTTAQNYQDKVRQIEANWKQLGQSMADASRKAAEEIRASARLQAEAMRNAAMERVAELKVAAQKEIADARLKSQEIVRAAREEAAGVRAAKAEEAAESRKQAAAERAILKEREQAIKEWDRAVAQVHRDSVREAQQAAKAREQAEKEWGRTVAQIHREEAREAQQAAKAKEQAYAQANANIRSGLQQLTVGSAVAAAALGTAVKSAAQEWGNFEQKLNTARAMTNASAADMQTFKEAAMQLGEISKFSATEIASSGVELIRMGANAKDAAILLRGVVSAAEASGESLSDIASTMSAVRNAFNLAATDSQRVSDVLVKASNLSATSIGNLNVAFRYVGSVAKSSNQSLEDMAGALAFLSQSGIDASMAGNHLQNMFVRLQAQPKDARDAIKEFGITLDNGKGKLRSMADIMDQLRTKLKGVSDIKKAEVAKHIFGEVALPSVMTLLNDTTGKLREFQKEVKNAGGYSDATAKKMRDGLLYEFEQLRGKMETAKSVMGEHLAPALIGIFNILDKLISAFTRLPDGLQKFITYAVLGGTTVAALTAFIGGLALAIDTCLAAAINLTGGLGALAAAETTTTATTTTLTGATNSLSGALTRVKAIASSTAFAIGAITIAATAAAAVLLDAIGKMNEALNMAERAENTRYELEQRTSGSLARIRRQGGAANSDQAAAGATEAANRRNTFRDLQRKAETELAEKQREMDAQKAQLSRPMANVAEVGKNISAVQLEINALQKKASDYKGRADQYDQENKGLTEQNRLLKEQEKLKAAAATKAATPPTYVPPPDEGESKKAATEETNRQKQALEELLKTIDSTHKHEMAQAKQRIAAMKNVTPAINTTVNKQIDGMISDIQKSAEVRHGVGRGGNIQKSLGQCYGAVWAGLSKMIDHTTYTLGDNMKAQDAALNLAVDKHWKEVTGTLAQKQEAFFKTKGAIATFATHGKGPRDYGHIEASLGRDQLAISDYVGKAYIGGNGRGPGGIEGRVFVPVGASGASRGPTKEELEAQAEYKQTEKDINDLRAARPKFSDPEILKQIDDAIKDKQTTLAELNAKASEESQKQYKAQVEEENRIASTIAARKADMLLEEARLTEDVLDDIFAEREKAIADIDRAEAEELQDFKGREDQKAAIIEMNATRRANIAFQAAQKEAEYWEQRKQAVEQILSEGERDEIEAKADSLAKDLALNDLATREKLATNKRLMDELKKKNQTESDEYALLQQRITTITEAGENERNKIKKKWAEREWAEREESFVAGLQSTQSGKQMVENVNQGLPSVPQKDSEEQKLANFREMDKWLTLNEARQTNIQLQLKDTNLSERERLDLQAKSVALADKYKSIQYQMALLNPAFIKHIKDKNVLEAIGLTTKEKEFEAISQAVSTTTTAVSALSSMFGEAGAKVGNMLNTAINGFKAIADKGKNGDWIGVALAGLSMVAEMVGQAFFPNEEELRKQKEQFTANILKLDQEILNLRAERFDRGGNTKGAALFKADADMKGIDQQIADVRKQMEEMIKENTKNISPFKWAWNPEQAKAEFTSVATDITNRGNQVIHELELKKKAVRDKALVEQNATNEKLLEMDRALANARIELTNNTAAKRKVDMKKELDDNAKLAGEAAQAGGGAEVITKWKEMDRLTRQKYDQLELDDKREQIDKLRALEDQFEQGRIGMMKDGLEKSLAQIALGTRQKKAGIQKQIQELEKLMGPAAQMLGGGMGGTKEQQDQWKALQALMAQADQENNKQTEEATKKHNQEQKAIHREHQKNILDMKSEGLDKSLGLIQFETDAQLMALQQRFDEGKLNALQLAELQRDVHAKGLAEREKAIDAYNANVAQKAREAAKQEAQNSGDLLKQIQVNYASTIGAINDAEAAGLKQFANDEKMKAIITRNANAERLKAERDLHNQLHSMYTERLNLYKSIIQDELKVDTNNYRNEIERLNDSLKPLQEQKKNLEAQLKQLDDELRKKLKALGDQDQDQWRNMLAGFTVQDETIRKALETVAHAADETPTGTASAKLKEQAMEKYLGGERKRLEDLRTAEEITPEQYNQRMADLLKVKGKFYDGLRKMQGLNYDDELKYLGEYATAYKDWQALQVQMMTDAANLEKQNIQDAIDANQTKQDSIQLAIDATQKHIDEIEKQYKSKTESIDNAIAKVNSDHLQWQKSLYGLDGTVTDVLGRIESQYAKTKGLIGQPLLMAARGNEEGNIPSPSNPSASTDLAAQQAKSFKYATADQQEPLEYRSEYGGMFIVNPGNGRYYKSWSDAQRDVQGYATGTQAQGDGFRYVHDGEPILPKQWGDWLRISATGNQPMNRIVNKTTSVQIYGNTFDSGVDVEAAVLNALTAHEEKANFANSSWHAPLN